MSLAQQAVTSQEPLTLKRLIHPEKIRQNLTQGQGRVGLMLRALDCDSVSISRKKK